MTVEKLKNILGETGYPVAYDHFSTENPAEQQNNNGQHRRRNPKFSHVPASYSSCVSAFFLALCKISSSSSRSFSLRFP